MLYQALQPCPFDREYLTGAFRFGRMILIGMADKLVKMILKVQVGDSDDQNISV